jgi:uncharacterized HAD superfamily protein
VSDLSNKTDNVREAYSQSGEGLDFKRVYFSQMEEFTQWLAEVKAAARDEVLEEAAQSIVLQSIAERHDMISARAVADHLRDLKEKKN